MKRETPRILSIVSDPRKIPAIIKNVHSRRLLINGSIVSFAANTIQFLWFCQRNEKNKRSYISSKYSYLRSSKITDLPRVNQEDLKKLYYSIGEVAKMFDVNTSLIRFWEKEFPMIKPKKNKKGNRLFTPKEVLKIDRIYHLVKEKGYTLEGAKKTMRSGASEDPVIESNERSIDHTQLINRLEEVKAKLLALKS